MAGLDGPFRRAKLRRRHAYCERGAGDHDLPDHFVDQSRRDESRTDSSARSGTGTRCDALGDAAHRRIAQCETRHRGSCHPGPRPRAGRNDPVTMVIGNHPDIVKNLFNPAYTLASVIANEFTEATGDLYVSALIEIGLALFLVTIVVNGIARILVWAVTRGSSTRTA